MGSFGEAVCPCGYRSETISVGVGMAGFSDYFPAPAVCLSCNIAMERNYQTKFARCPSCKKKVTFYNDPSLQSKEIKPDPEDTHWNLDVPGKDNFDLPDTQYLCPKCGKFELIFDFSGCFD